MNERRNKKQKGTGLRNIFLEIKRRKKKSMTPIFF